MSYVYDQTFTVTSIDLLAIQWFELSCADGCGHWVLCVAVSKNDSFESIHRCECIVRISDDVLQWWKSIRNEVCIELQWYCVSAEVWPWSWWVGWCRELRRAIANCTAFDCLMYGLALQKESHPGSSRFAQCPVVSVSAMILIGSAFNRVAKPLIETANASTAAEDRFWARIWRNVKRYWRKEPPQTTYFVVRVTTAVSDD